MATVAPEKTTTEPSPAAESPKPSRFKLRINLRSKTLRLVGVLVIIMVVEAAVMSMLLPKPAAVAESKTSVSESAITAGTGGESPQINTVEVEIGRFYTTNGKADPTVVLHVSFSLVTIVAQASQREFEEAKQTHDARMHQAIERVCRSASLEDLNDPNLSAIRRLIRDELNKVLRSSYVIEVVISEFKTIAQ